MRSPAGAPAFRSFSLDSDRRDDGGLIRTTSPLPIRTCGNITAHAVAGGFCAVTRFRDHDGVTRKAKRVGRTAAVAKNRLREELRDRARSNA